ncbi:MAG: FAD:protein FMN transferase [Vicinamibacterales bacterium]
MGTRWTVTLAPASRSLDRGTRNDIDRAIRDELGRLERLMSTWMEDSELSRFNRQSSTEPFPVDADLFAVFQAAAALTAETEHALDITVLPAVEAWGFGAHGRQGDPPDERALEGLRERTGMRHLDLDPDGRWIRKRRPDVQCDVAAIAPGYAADRLASILQRRVELSGFLIDVGGELVARGRNADGRPWQIAIEGPWGRETPARIITLEDSAVATSGDYRNYRMVGGERVTHIIDPRTARPIRHRLASVTVVDRTATRADALATALMVLGPEDGMSLARRLDLDALFIVASHGQMTTEGRAGTNGTNGSKGSKGNGADGFVQYMTPRFERRGSGS